MTTYLDEYYRRMNVYGSDDKDRLLSQGIENFNRILDEKLSPTVHDVHMMKNGIDLTTVHNVRCEISNVTMNDQRSYDEKYIHFKLNEGVTVGSYVKWRNKFWMCMFEEINSFNTHLTFTMKRCNNTFNFKYKGIMYELPVIVSNLTLYSDGLAEAVYITKPDAKRTVVVSNNDITKNIKIDTRIMLTNNTIYKVTHVDDFSHIGVRNLTLTQTTLTSQDDLINNVAHNEDSEIDIPVQIGDIVGDDKIYLGDYSIYYIENNSNENITWELVNSEGVEIVSQDLIQCKLICSDESKFVNKEFDLQVIKSNGVIKSKKIMIRGFA